MPYTPDATVLTQPADTGVLAATAAAEFRTIKTYMSAVLLAAINARVVSGGALGTPSSGNLANCTGYPAPAVSSLTGAAAGVLTFLASGALVGMTGLPVATGISGLGANVAAFLATPSSANLISAVTDETGTGSLVFGTAPVLANPTVTNYVETVYAPAAGSAFTVDLANGTHQVFTTNANCTITLPAAVAGKSYVIDVIYGGAHTLTWAGGGTVRWANGTSPTPTSVNGKRDIFGFMSPDGSNTHCSIINQNYAA